MTARSEPTAAPTSDQRGATLDMLADTAGAQAPNELVGLEHSLAAVQLALDGEDVADPDSAISVLRRGLAVSPELRRGIGVSIGFAIVVAIGRLMIPVLIQQVLDRGFRGDQFRPGFVYTACGLAALVVLGVSQLMRISYLRLMRAAEATLYGLRVRVFEHIHRLSIAEHTDSRKGVLVARVTSDIETLARFAQWGGVSWVVNSTLIVMTLAVMLVYSWVLTIVVVVAFAPSIPVLRYMQRHQLAAYDAVRNRTSDLLSEVSETVTGIAVVRGYGLEVRARRRLRDRIEALYRAHLRAARFFAAMFTVGDIFGSLALGGVTAVAAFHGDTLGLQFGQVVAFLFLVQVLLNPIAELSEILDLTQTAVAGWRKVLAVLDVPLDVTDPDDEAGRLLPAGALSVRANDVDFAYRDGDLVLRNVSVDIAAGARVAIVGETGSGKTTFAKLLCRLADPVRGAVEVGGLSLRDVDGASRREAIRLVPQDGFLFDTSIRENVRLGRHGATDADIESAFEGLGLRSWVDQLPEGLDTVAGERGDNLSVGERQLVALARAQLGRAGLLVLDEATSAVDPETERALSEALDRLATGRTTVSIAHRLSTAQASDLVLVFDAGRLVEQGDHDELVAVGGVYAGLYESWIGNTRTATVDAGEDS
jgi:ABC-type multidrug transport system fused ATPase/permease subunit